MTSGWTATSATIAEETVEPAEQDYQEQPEEKGERAKDEFEPNRSKTSSVEQHDHDDHAY